jgi:predicted PurR-regulated permease PerM
MGGSDLGTVVLYRSVDAPPVNRSPRLIRLTARSAVAVAVALLATLVLRNLFVEAHRVIGWAVACSVVAALVGPLVGRVAHVVPRPIALIVVGLAIAAVVSVLVYGVFDDLDTETARLRQDGVAAAHELEDRTDRLGQGAREIGLVDRATAFFNTLDERISSGGDALRSAAGTAPTYFVNWILTIFLIIYGGRIVNGAIGLLRDEEREARIRTLVADGSANATSYVAASILQGLVVALLATGAVLALDLPAPVLLPLLAGTMAMLPYIGVLIGALPLVLLAAGLESLAAGTAVLAVAAGLQAVEAFVVRPRVDTRSVHVGPAIPVIVAAVGYEIYGVGAAFYGVVIAIFLLAFADAAASDDDPIPLPTEEPTEDLTAEPSDEPSDQPA